MKITDLLQEYEESIVSLPSAEDGSTQRVKALVHSKLPRRRRGRTVLLAAAVVALVGVTAAAVGMGLWDKARADLGLGPHVALPEYVEYEAKHAGDDTPTVSVVSALWTNVDSTIYLSIENPLTEMTVPLEDSPWGADLRELTASGIEVASCRVEHVSYDEENHVVLLRCDLSVKNLIEAETCSFGLYWSPSYWPIDRPAMAVGLVTVEIPTMRRLRAEIHTPYDNPYMDIEGTVAAFDIYANSFRITMEVPAFEEACQRLDGHGNIAAAYWNAWKVDPIDPSAYDETDARVAYDRSWRNPWDDFAIVYRDGTKVPFEELEDQAATLFFEDSGQSFGYAFRQPVDLDQLEAVYYHGEEYPLLSVVD